MTLVLSVGLLGLTGIFFFVALRLYKLLDAWYREDASRLWHPSPWRWTLPVVGLGSAIIGLAFIGAAIQLIGPWALLGASLPVALWFFVLGKPAISPMRHALDEVRRHPLDYPTPTTPRGDQPRVALLIFGGLAALLALLIGFAIWFATKL